MEQPALSTKNKARSLIENYRSQINPVDSAEGALKKTLVDVTKNVIPKGPEDSLRATQVASFAGADGLDAEKLDSVVKVFATHSTPCYSRPWQMEPQSGSIASSFVLNGRRLLTNAHAVVFCTVIRVQRRSNDTKYVAKILSVAEDCDLALLTVEEEEFWNGLTPLKFGTFPSLQDNVTVVGYPIGGTNISITKGFVSRIKLHSYSFGHEFLAIQIDAAVNFGNSGGPTFNKNGEVIGVAFQKGDSESNGIGYIIGLNVVQRFLDDLEKNGSYMGYSYSGIWWQSLEDESFRRYLKMEEDQSGVLVRGIDKRSSAVKALKKGDILLRVEDINVSNSGTILHSSGERIFFHAVISEKHVGDDLKLSIIRDGKEMEITYPTPGYQNNLVPVLSGQRLPEYFIVGGLVFTVLTQPFMIYEYGPFWISNAPHDFITVSDLEYDDDVLEIVILSHILETEVNIHYEDTENERLVELNGQKVESLRHLSQMVNECTDEFLRFDLSETVIVLDRNKTLSSDKEILKTFQIPSLSRFNDPKTIVKLNGSMDHVPLAERIEETDA